MTAVRAWPRAFESHSSRALRCCWALLLLVGLSPSASARRLPAPGGKVTLALPAELVAKTIEAHSYVPLVERVSSSGNATRPALIGQSQWWSSVLLSLTSDASKTRWTATSDAPTALVVESLTRCLTKSGSAWPATVLALMGVKVTVEASADGVTVRFSQPVGPVPELLEGCSLRGASTQTTGPYATVSPGVLAFKGGAFSSPPLLGVLEFAAPNARADLAAFGVDAPGSTTLLAPFPDALLLLQSAGARDRGVLGFSDPSTRQRDARELLNLLRPDLLAAAYGQGRGARLEGLLPPGVAPARPLQLATPRARSLPLALLDLPSNAPHITVVRAQGDTLVDVDGARA